MIVTPNQLASSKSRKRRVLVVDDHAIVRQGILMQISQTNDLEPCGEASTTSEALRKIDELRPDIVITDLFLPDRNGIELIRDAFARHKDLLFLVVSMHDESLYAERVLRAGAKGYVMKDAIVEDLNFAIQTVASGGVYLSPKMASRIVSVFSGSKGEDSGHSILNLLTDRELQVFELIGHGFSNQAIAERLSITARTADAHKTKIKSKLKIPDMSALARYAVLWVETNKS